MNDSDIFCRVLIGQLVPGDLYHNLHLVVAINDRSVLVLGGDCLKKHDFVILEKADGSLLSSSQTDHVRKLIL